MPSLPGQDNPNTPALPNTTPDTAHPKVPEFWDTVDLVSSAVFDMLKREGKPAADALLAWIKSRREK